MEIMSEFDIESPLYVSFCTRVSPEDFERQSLTYTQKCLKDLYTKMEQNPKICERVVRKRKQMKKRQAGWVPYLKARFFSLFNYNTSMDMKEIEREVAQMKNEMQRVNFYASAAKQSYLWSLARKPRRSRPLGGFNSAMTRAVPAMPRIFGPYPPQAERSTGSSTALGRGGMSSARPNRPVDLHPVCLSSFGGINAVSHFNTTTYPSFPSIFTQRSPLQNAGPSTSSSTTNPAPRPPMANPTTEDKTDNENPGPSSHSRGP